MATAARTAAQKVIDDILVDSKVRHAQVCYQVANIAMDGKLRHT